jgi:signal transduction histidine kinase
MRSRPLIIVALLLACLGLIGVLGWQSWQLQRSNDAAARSVLRDYATLAADEYGRRLTAALGYRGYFQVVSRFGDAVDAASLRASLQDDETVADAMELVDGVFVAGADGVSVDGMQSTAELLRYLEALFNSAADLGGPYLAVAADGDRPQLVYTRSEDSSRLLGFTVNAAGVEGYLRGALDMEPLLPVSLGDGAVGNDRLFVEVLDGTGRTLMLSNLPFADAQIVEKVMGDNYQGVVEGLRLRVAVDPVVASTLLIGGLPADQLPLLIVVMALAVALLLAAIWLFRQEHAMMRMRADFVSQVSHELRTPLTQIRMFAETLLLKRTRSEKESQRALQVIDRESRRLSHLVENILRFSSLSDSVSLSPALQPLAPVIQEVCAATRMTNPQVTIETVVDESVLAMVDDDALRQILLNLLDNAIKYGPTGQTITLSVTCADEIVQIEIADQGPGIPEGGREQVWDAFYRLEKEQQTAISGTGIGLAVVRELVEAMGGRCWVADSAAGATIALQLPGASDNE